MLVGNRDIGCGLTKACNLDVDSDAVAVCSGCNYCKKEYVKMKNQFNGSFEAIDQKDSTPASLLALILMILDGPNI